MICIQNYNTNCYFNLAAEEYLLRQFDQDVFMLWQSTPSVVAGKHQNVLAEINLPFVLKENIKIARRLSGGGTVYHDLGNLNFTIIRTEEQGKQVDFKKYTQDIRKALEKFGLATKFEGHNSITYKGLKISGNAEHVFKNRVLHHGTLLFSTDLDKLNQAIEIVPGVYQDKAVKSVRSRVTNFGMDLKHGNKMEKFRDLLMQYMRHIFKDSYSYEFTDTDIESILRIKKEKYETRKWIFSYSPKYSFQKISNISDRMVEVHMEVKKGAIEFIEISGDLADPEVFKYLAQDLSGTQHEPFELGVILNKYRHEFPKSQEGEDSLLRAFF